MKAINISPRKQLAAEIWKKFQEEVSGIIQVQLDAEMIAKIYSEEELRIILEDFTEHYRR